MKLDTADPQFKALIRQLNSLPESEKAVLTQVIYNLVEETEREQAQVSFLSFILQVMPEFVINWHHEEWAGVAEDIAITGKKRIIINVAPRSSKSQFWSILFPAWFMGRFPKKKLLVLTHTESLSEDWGQKVRDVIDSDEYRKVFPNVTLDPKNKSKSNWRVIHKDPKTGKTSIGESYFAGVTSKIAGRGADLLVCDDLHSEQDVSDEAFDRVWEKWPGISTQRIQPGASILLLGTRWSTRDVFGRVLAQDAARTKTGKKERWQVIKYAAQGADGKWFWCGDEGGKNQWFNKEEWEEKKETTPIHEWNARYQQNPTSAEASIFKKESWKVWKKDYLPQFEYIIQTMDTAFGLNDESNFSIIQSWGIFRNQKDEPNMMLIHKYKGRPSFTQLKDIAFALAEDKPHKELNGGQRRGWKPDGIFIEAKATGAPLIDEMRQKGIPVVNYTPTRATGNKVERANAVSTILESGIVWVQENDPAAEELIEECAQFPRGLNDDDVDTFVLACMRFRKGGFISLKDDYDEDEREEDEDYASTTPIY